MEQRVRTHIFLCMLAYYVEWYMREAWRPLLLCDEELEGKSLRDRLLPPAQRSEPVRRKVYTKTLEDGAQVQSFQISNRSAGSFSILFIRHESMPVHRDHYDT